MIWNAQQTAVNSNNFTPRNLVNMYRHEQQIGCKQQKDIEGKQTTKTTDYVYKQLCMIQARENFLTFPNTRLGRLVPFSTFSSLL